MFTPETAHPDYPALDLDSSTVQNTVDDAICNHCNGGDIADIAEALANEIVDDVRSALWNLHHPDYTPDIGDDEVTVDPDEDPLDVLRSTLADLDPDALRDAYTPPVYDHDLEMIYSEYSVDVDEFAADYDDLNGIVIAHSLGSVIARVTDEWLADKADDVANDVVNFAADAIAADILDALALVL